MRRRVRSIWPDVNADVVSFAVYAWRCEEADDPDRSEVSDYTPMHVISRVLLGRVRDRLRCTEDQAAVEIRHAVAEDRAAVVSDAAETQFACPWITADVEGATEIAGVVVTASDERAIYPQLIEQMVGRVHDAYLRAAVARARA